MRLKATFPSPATARRAFLVGTIALLSCQKAYAAEVHVVQGRAPDTPGVFFVAAPGESNSLVVAYEGSDLVFRDAGAAITAGTGCGGGGAVGTPARCTVPPPINNCYGPFLRSGRFARAAQPGRLGRRSPIPCFDNYPAGTVDLGDGSNTLDSTAVTYGPLTRFEVRAGDGDDRISTGSTDDRTSPGRGSDIVHSGDGGDVIEAADGPADGPDIYDAGANSEPFHTTDKMDYTAEDVPLTITLDDQANDGASGEGDNVLNVNTVFGGPQDDTIVGNDDGNMLTGEHGSDHLIGGAGGDQLFDYYRSFLHSGDDVLEGGSGTDTFYLGDGNDLLLGGPDPDVFAATYALNAVGTGRMHGGPGDDVIFGTLGRDRIFGEQGNDRSSPGPGRDFVALGTGNDAVYSDDDERDAVRCGSGKHDDAVPDVKDRLSSCEWNRDFDLFGRVRP